MFWGSFVFEFIGASVRFGLQYIMHLFFDRKLKTFREIWNGPDQDDPINSTSYGFSNILIGFCTLMIFVLLTFYVF